jgi:hypothetical protein
VKLLAAVVLCLSVSAQAAPAPTAWPAAAREARPWTYWWWPGSAVDPQNLTRTLTRFQQAGFGGVHIIPIYGAKGYESRYIEYLSPRWLEMLNFTVTEAERLGLGVDMTTGSGWCFGGPNIPVQMAASLAVAKKNAAGEWEVTLRPGIKVKRPAPGGEGYMLNPFYRPAIDQYLKRFTEAFATYKGKRPRAMYHDSFEYQVNWSPDFPEEFARRRGYRIEKEYGVLFGEEASDRSARVRSDYRETLSDLLLDNFTQPWVNWVHARKILTRNQAHGSPGNLLDLYAAADIPETEMFNRDRSSLVSKFASSAAHVTGRKYVASETGTWLREHFTERLADVKELVDQLLLAGVNHIVYHGSCFSPDDAPWPGWLFYASTEMNSRNAFWRDVPALNAYAARSQSMLQEGRSDNDLLVYWPVYDQWHNAKGMQQTFSVHHRDWLEEQAMGKLGHRLLERGYAFDVASDRQIAGAKAETRQARLPGGAYRAILVPQCHRMPLATLRKLIELAGAGVPVLFDGAPPDDVPGLASLDARRAELRTLLEKAKAVKSVQAGEAEELLRKAGVRRESMTDGGALQTIRRATALGPQYFIANRGKQRVEAWAPLAARGAAAVLLDPMRGTAGVGSSRKGAAGDLEVYLQLEAGESVCVRVLPAAPAGVAKWAYWQAADETLPVDGGWKVTFVEGGPELPAAARVSQLKSWTKFAGKAGEVFGGTARYAIEFDAAAGDWELDLGDVRESAKVKLNNRELGTLIVAPFRIAAQGLKAKGNMLEIEVTNLSANRIRDLDRRKVSWKIMHDINFVNMDYKPFDASGWEVRESGLLGPVQLRRVTRLDPR